MTNTTTVEKVRIPAEVAEAIEFYRSEEGGPSYSNKKLIELVTRISVFGELVLVMKQYAGENFDTFVKVLYNGYEIEKPPKKITLELTPEELGTIVATMAVADPLRADVYAEGYSLTVLGGRCGSEEVFHLFKRLKQRYYEEARA
jgi:hypothetical protein